ncbi:Proline utilization trans-activator like protein [Verticillium longisporum]|uniref:Proline utilization trans-activator like protein n=1 Tax=Verticillium longisporum TaxID=100787 RepID=A0A8I2ZGH0_VERLO|nr:Proline utilization trans-activator like protein [Verticillium longisporum]
MPILHQEQHKVTKKVLQACERCRLMKVKCSGTEPCARCTRTKKVCQFAPEAKRVSVSESLARLDAMDTGTYYGSLDSYLRDLQMGHLTLTITYHLNAMHPQAIAPQAARQQTLYHQHPQHNDDQRPEHEDEDNHTRASSPTHPVNHNFWQNPLVDNDYTFAKVEGRYWYMGPSSTWALCRRVLALIGKRIPEGTSAPDPWHLDGKALRLRWRPVALDETPDVSNLPPLDYALFLFNTVKFYLGLVFYIIDEPTFLRNLHEFYENPVVKASACRSWFAQYLFVLAYGKAFIVNQSSPEGPAGYQYAVRAMGMLPDLSGLDSDQISGIQALALAAVYLQSVDMRLAAFQHIGQALRICIIEGMHRHMPEDVVGEAYSQQCNVVFWVVYQLDREFSALIGAPSSIRDEDITVRSPSEMFSSIDMLNMGLQVRLSRLMARILTTVYGAGKQFDGSLVRNTKSILRDLAQLSKDLNHHLNTHFQGTISKTSRIALRLILSYHYCVVLTTRPLVMCALHMHIEQKDTPNSQAIALAPPVASLMQSCVDSAQTVLHTLRVIGDEDLLEAFLPFQLEDAFSSAFILYLIRAITPALIQDNNWTENIRSALDKMISKGSIVAPLRKLELSQLEMVTAVLSPTGNVGGCAKEPMAAAVEHDEQEAAQTHDEADEAGWDMFMADCMIGLSPREMLDLAEQLGAESMFSPYGHVDE